ncbi:uncharacterized protein RHO17_026526 [Thomomys bottae]
MKKALQEGHKETESQSSTCFNCISTSPPSRHGARTMGRHERPLPLDVVDFCRNGPKSQEIPWNETNGSPGFGRVSSEQMGRQQPESLLPLAESSILEVHVL